MGYRQEGWGIIDERYGRNCRYVVELGKNGAFSSFFLRNSKKMRIFAGR